MYCNTSRSAAELKEICLQCFSRHLKSRCSRRMRLLRERQSFKCCEPSNSYCGQQLLPSTGVGWPQVWWPSRSSRRVSTWKMGKGQSKKQPSSPESAGACVQCQGQKSEITSVIQTHLLPTPPCQPQLAANLVSKIYTIFGNGTRLTPDFVFKPRVSLMHAAGWKRHCFTAQILNEAVQSEKKAWKNKMKWKSTQSLLGKGKAKVWNPLQPKYTRSHSSKKAPCPTFIQQKQSC